ncbi:MAG TPA: hypothetical protein VJ207_04020 [Thermoplasmata archaeon]|nr:hypothetical protein [Thermoplasmata archaeon]
MRWLLYAAAALVFLAGVQLFIFSEQTAMYFAWTVAPPFTAAFLGAAYWAAVPVEVIAARQMSWAQARAAIPGIWLFTALTLVATLLHFDRFHFSSPDPTPQAAAWLWLGIYTVVPVAMLLIAILQTRGPGGDPDRVKTLPSWLRIALIVVGGGMMAVGLVLFATPAAIIPVWPWPLTPLTARAIGAWFLGIGLGAFLAYRENDFARVRPVGAGYAFFAVLEFVALARYLGEVSWSNPAAWVYLAFLIALLPIGLYLWLGFRERRESLPA